MAKIGIGINGFGRIGRQALKAIFQKYQSELQVVAINDLFDMQTNAHLLRFDTNYGRFKGQVEAKGDTLQVGDWQVQSFAQRDPSRIPWQDAGADIVLEATGIFRSRDKAAQHLQAGAKKVIITAPGKEEDLTVVLGVNQDRYDPDQHHILSNASCTTNCLAPPLKVLQQAYGISQGTMTTVHAFTNDQRILDQPHKDLRRARSASGNIIPTTTGAAQAVGLVLPELEGRIQGYAMRVPTPTVSVIDCTLELERQTNTQELRGSLQQAAQNELKGIMAYSQDQAVSSDFLGDCHSSIIDWEFTYMPQSQGNWAKLMAWYDNEWGYACRLADLARLLASRGL
ncbi:MAG: type I glyceraldehyde-3-phosphate dehydrogenase [Thermodesulfobacteriota bacterium]